MMLPLVMTAGGRSNRVGHPKGLMKFAGRTWLEHQIARFGAAGGGELTVVLGFDADKYIAALPWLCEKSSIDGVQVRSVQNLQPEHGPFSSLQAGLRNARPTAILFTHIDMPVPGTDSLAALCKSSVEQPHAIVVPRVSGKGGHPVVLPERFLVKILATDPTRPDARLDLLIAREPADHRIALALSDPDLVTNLNSLPDWETYLSAQAPRTPPRAFGHHRK